MAWGGRGLVHCCGYARWSRRDDWKIPVLESRVPECQSRRGTPGLFSAEHAPACLRPWISEASLRNTCLLVEPNARKFSCPRMCSAARTIAAPRLTPQAQAQPHRHRNRHGRRRTDMGPSAPRPPPGSITYSLAFGICVASASASASVSVPAFGPLDPTPNDKRIATPEARPKRRQAGASPVRTDGSLTLEAGWWVVCPSITKLSVHRQKSISVFVSDAAR